MRDLLKRWYALAPREQNLAVLVAFAVVGMLYVLIVVDPLEAAIKAQQTEVGRLTTQMDEDQQALNVMREQLAADPNLPFRRRLIAAEEQQASLQQQVDSETASLISPQQMKNLLQTLLKQQPELQLDALGSFTEPLQLTKPSADNDQSVTADTSPPKVAVLYQHGVRLQLTGSYFEVLKYLQSVETSGWRLYWRRLDYQVGEAGAGKASVQVEVYTLSRSAEWIGV
ncbi:type II secretion system protein GspM [Atopomonas sediminilitoris]|uniref:type II secretion system protein GspM n=1 Tax=Atopomonas sediminilitoris TaxID=2919919 RepID=UPI001F4E0D35|nr:type II secretion system protein GspM [Atopomonas sediminilitoris]MCJ8168401.1 type II secretion system protein M [Atopomonas sediminilitoris]